MALDGVSAVDDDDAVGDEVVLPTKGSTKARRAVSSGPTKSKDNKAVGRGGVVVGGAGTALLLVVAVVVVVYADPGKSRTWRQGLRVAIGASAVAVAAAAAASVTLFFAKACAVTGKRISVGGLFR